MRSNENDSLLTETDTRLQMLNCIVKSDVAHRPITLLQGISPNLNGS